VFPQWFTDELAPDAESVARILEGLLDHDWLAHGRPEHVTVPTLILVGEDEDPDQDAEAAAAAMPQGQAVYFAGRGHVGVWPGAPKESVDHALPFLRRVLAPRPPARS
jgi:pimeloyl-ACP methyl ester carboxylesterase